MVNAYYFADVVKLKYFLDLKLLNQSGRGRRIVGGRYVRKGKKIEKTRDLYFVEWIHREVSRVPSPSPASL